MSNWTLSVDLRGTGTSLATELRQSATHARALGTASKNARTHIRGLGKDSETAARHVRTLGNSARTAARDVSRLGSSTHSADRGLASLGGHARTAVRDLARMTTQLNSTVRDLNRLATASARADARLARLGLGGAAGLRHTRTEADALHRRLLGMANLLAGGALFMGGKELLKEGAEYQQAMNTFGATTDATRMQMLRAGATANQLGNDLTLPKATAADAAEAMVELSKAGFRTDQAISATRASLQLSAAAQVNAADSARYLGDMMDQFGLGADQASTAADTLAATANAASGGITDIYYAMKYAGPVAHGIGMSMQEAAAGVGMLHKQGIIGQTAGTSLRGMFVNMAKPTHQMSEGLHDLGIEAYDAQGQFKGLRTVVEGLEKAQHRMSQQDFTAAAAKAFGKPALPGAIALAHQGVQSYDALLSTISKTGSVTSLAEAQGKGLAGAMVQLKTQARQTGLAIYQGMAPGLEWLTRGMTTGLNKATPHIEHFFQYLNDAATLFGPDIKRAIRSHVGDVEGAVSDMVAPFKDVGNKALADFVHLLLTAGGAAVRILTNLAHGVQPVADGLASLSDGGDSVVSSLDLVVTVLDLLFRALGYVSGVLVPVGHAVGALAHSFGALPGPVQQFILAALLVRRVLPLMTGLATTVGGRVTGSFRSLGQQMAIQRQLAAMGGAAISRYGAAFAVLQTRVPVVGAMAASFRGATAAGAGFAGTLRGITAAAGTGLRGAMSGLMGALGGPWGVALTGLTVGLGILASAQQSAAARAAEHRATIDGLTQAMRQSNGIIDETVRQQAAQAVQSTKLTGVNGHLMDVLGQVGYSLSDVTDAYLGQGTSIDDLVDKLKDLAKEQKTAFEHAGSDKERDLAADRALSYESAAKALKGMSGDAEEAAKKAKDLNAATKGTKDGASAYDKLKTSVKALADTTGDADSRTRALRDALDLLSGGSISLQAAQARVHEAITNANEAMAAGVNHADGWHQQLLKSSGAIDTTTKNGQALFSTLDSIAEASSQAALAAFDFAKSQGKDVPEAVAAARKEMQDARDSAMKLAGGYGLTKDEAAGVADAMGLIPGQVSILLTTKGLDTGLAELLGVQAEFKRLPKEKTIKVEALGEDAKKDLEEIGYKIELIPGTREYKITAPTTAARHELDLLINKLAATNGKTLPIKAPSAAAIKELSAIQTKVAGTHGKTLTMRAPTAEAQANLQALGFSIKQNARDKTVTISLPTGGPISAAAAIQAAISNIHGHDVGIGVYLKATSSDSDANGVPDMIQNPQANGSVLDFYASGGTNRQGRRENHVAQIAPRGAWRVWAEPETDGEGYVPFAASKRPRSRAITEEIVRRLGGDPAGIEWNASGSVTDWRYDPSTGTLYSASDAGQAGHKTRKVKVKGGEDKEIDYFDLSAVESKLKANSRANAEWAKNLTTVAERAGSDVAAALEGMGEDGVALTAKMAKGTTKYVNEMAASLRGLGATAKATLTDYTRQLTKVSNTNTSFATDLAKLAAAGYGDLAAQLSAQGDEAAQQLAAEAVKDKGKASKANTQAQRANAQLTPDQISELVSIIAAVKSSRTGLHDVADTTGLGEDEIVTVAGKASPTIRDALGARATKFLADLARAQKGLSYADGGIREGIYATQNGIVRFAEPSTQGEAYIPLASRKRMAATAVLHDVAGRFGLGITDAASSGRVIVIRQDGDTHVSVSTVRTGASASDIGAQVGRSVRRARRGGVAARD